MNLIAQLNALPLTWPEKLAYLTHRFLDLEQSEYPLRHLFDGGLYIREISIPAGELIIGREHRHGHLCQLLSGSIVLNSQDGQVRFDAPAEFTSRPGYQMVVQALTDVVARTVHPNPCDSRDIAALEQEAFVPENGMLALGKAVHVRLTRYAYQALKDEAGITPDIENKLRDLYTNTDDIIDFTTPVKVEIGPSTIEGHGVMTKAPIILGERICPIRIGPNRTPAGRYLNHSDSPNAKCFLEDRSVYVDAIWPIPSGSEVLVNYRDVLNTTSRLEVLS